uniref:Uncharacterized protein n=1 Tax=Arundo donax TaxID=35708 RepID=A0A0A9C1V4_ARUDO
MEELMIISSS